jgi:hypothetical protein
MVLAGAGVLALLVAVVLLIWRPWVKPVPTLVLSTTSVTGGRVGEQYSQTLLATGGKPPYTWKLLRNPLPGGLQLAGDGTIQGVPQADGRFAFTVQVGDSAAHTVDREFAVSIADDAASAGKPNPPPAAVSTPSTAVETSSSPPAVITPPPPRPVETPPALSITTASLPEGTVNRPYTPDLLAAGGTKPYHWRIVRGSLPKGINLNASGAFTGVPTAEGTFSFTVRVDDSKRKSADEEFTLHIKSGQPVVTNPPPPPQPTTWCPAEPVPKLNPLLPRRGTIIWQGQPGQLVVIQGARVANSQGYVTRQSEGLVGAPVQVKIEGGNPKEEPNARNGWSCVAFESTASTVTIRWELN